MPIIETNVSASWSCRVAVSRPVLRQGQRDVVDLGNLHAKRDWGFVRDYVWLVLQQAEADDYVLATGEMRSVKEFCELAAAAL